MLSAGRGKGRSGEKYIGNKKHNWQVQNRQWEVKNSVENGEAKELISVSHGYELSGGGCGWEVQDKGGKMGQL